MDITDRGSFKSRKRAAPASLPANAAWLDHATLTLAVHEASVADKHRLHLHLHSSSSKRRVHYDLTVRSSPKAGEPLAWVVTRTFSDYVALQQRLLASLKPGHACNAECAWLYNVLKHHFPRKSLFCSSCKVESRRKALARVLTTVRASLVNRGNLVCGVLRDRVCQEFVSFLLGDDSSVLDSSSSTLESEPSKASLLTKSSSNISSTSLVSLESEETDRYRHFTDELASKARDRSSSSCSSSSSSTCEGGVVQRYYRRGSSSATSTKVAVHSCCRRHHREQFRDDYALATPKNHGVGCSCAPSA